MRKDRFISKQMCGPNRCSEERRERQGRGHSRTGHHHRKDKCEGLRKTLGLLAAASVFPPLLSQVSVMVTCTHFDQRMSLFFSSDLFIYS